MATGIEDEEDEEEAMSGVDSWAAGENADPIVLLLKEDAVEEKAEPPTGLKTPPPLIEFPPIELLLREELEEPADSSAKMAAGGASFEAEGFTAVRFTTVSVSPEGVAMMPSAGLAVGAFTALRSGDACLAGGGGAFGAARADTGAGLTGDTSDDDAFVVVVEGASPPA